MCVRVNHDAGKEQDKMAGTEGKLKVWKMTDQEKQQYNALKDEVDKVKFINDIKATHKVEER